MSRSASPLKPSFALSKCSAIAALALTLCACSTPAPVSQPPQPQPLAVANCPKLVPLGDDSFGAWVLWAQYAAGQYAKCRAAVMGD